MSLGNLGETNLFGSPTGWGIGFKTGVLTLEKATIQHRETELTETHRRGEGGGKREREREPGVRHMFRDVSFVFLSLDE